MPTYTITAAWDTGATVRGRVTDYSGANLGETAMAETSPGDYAGDVTIIAVALFPLFFEVRVVTAQTSGGFDAGTNVYGPALLDTGPTGGGEAASPGAVSVNLGGVVSLPCSIQLNGQPVDPDGGALTVSLSRNGSVLVAPTIRTVRHGLGDWEAFATIDQANGFGIGDAGALRASAVINGVRTPTKSQPFTVVAAVAVVAPMTAAVAGVLFVTRDLPRVPSGSAPLFAWTVTDATGAAIDLSAKLVRFVAASVTEGADPFADAESALFKYESGTAALAIGGASSNVVTLQLAAADTAAHIGDLRYWLLNATDMQVLAAGRLPVVPAALNYP